MANKFDIGRFDNCPTKEWLQSSLYSHIGTRMKSNVMMVGSPSFERQITNGFKIASTPKARVYLVEKDLTRYREMAKRFWGNCISSDEWPEDWHNRVHLVRGDVVGYEIAAGLDRPVRFEDLDMCQTMRFIQYLVGHRLLLQSKLRGEFRKCMLVTSSLRRCELDETLAILQKLLSEILGVKSVVWPNIKGCKHAGIHRSSGVREYAPYIEKHGRLLKNGLRLFSYRDGAPMFTCMILYI